MSKTRRRWWCVVFVFSLVGCDGLIVIDETLQLEELSESEMGIVCRRYEEGEQQCDWGGAAGFSSEEQCVDVLRSLQSSELYSCRTMRAGAIYDCLDVPICDRPTHELCDKFYTCVLYDNAARDGVELDVYYY